MFTFDFEASRLEFAEGGARQEIKGYAFRKTIQRNNPTMSILMEDGRMCRFSFAPGGQAGKFRLVANIIEYADFGGGLTVRHPAREHTALMRALLCGVRVPARRPVPCR